MYEYIANLPFREAIQKIEKSRHKGLRFDIFEGADENRILGLIKEELGEALDDNLIEEYHEEKAVKKSVGL